jgi:hypothetical protein
VVVRIDKGEELVDCLKTICKKLDIKLGSIVGIGSTDKVTIGLLNTKTKKYQSKEFTGDHEITSLVGNITMMNGDVYLHLHITVGNVEHKAIGGHLTSAIISATFEGIIDIMEGIVIREYNDDVGLNQLKLT